MNRFSKIVDSPKWEADVPIEMLQKALLYKEDLFNKNQSIVAQTLQASKKIGDSIINDEARAKFNEQYSKIKDNINSKYSSDVDLSDMNVLSTITSEFSPLVDNHELTSTISKELTIRDSMNLMNKFKLDNDERYSAEHERTFQLELQQYKQSPMGANLNPSYRTAYDADGEIQKLIAAYKPDHVKTTRVKPGGYLYEEEDASVNQEKLYNYIQANLSNQGKEELLYRGYGQYLANYAMNPDPLTKNLYKAGLVESYQFQVQSKLKALDVDMTSTKASLLIHKDNPELISTLTQKLSEQENDKKELTNKLNFTSNPNNVSDKMLLGLASDTHFLNTIGVKAATNAHIDNSKDIKVDETYFKQRTLNLEQAKVNESIRQHNYEHQDRMLELQAKYGNTTSPFGGSQDGVVIGDGPVNPDEARTVYGQVVSNIENTFQQGLQQIQTEFFDDYLNSIITNGTDAQRKAVISMLPKDRQKAFASRSARLTADDVFALENNATLVSEFNNTVTNYMKMPPEKRPNYGWIKDWNNNPQRIAWQTAYDKHARLQEKLTKDFNDDVTIVDPKTNKKRKLTSTEQFKLANLMKEIESANYGGLTDYATLSNLKGEQEQQDKLLKKGIFANKAELEYYLDIVHNTMVGETTGIGSQIVNALGGPLKMSPLSPGGSGGAEGWLNSASKKLKSADLNNIGQLPSITLRYNKKNAGDVQRNTNLIAHINKDLQSKGLTLLPDEAVITAFTYNSVTYSLGSTSTTEDGEKTYSPAMKTVPIDGFKIPGVREILAQGMTEIEAKIPNSTSGRMIYGTGNHNVSATTTKEGRVKVNIDGKEFADYQLAAIMKLQPKSWADVVNFFNAMPPVEQERFINQLNTQQ